MLSYSTVSLPVIKLSTRSCALGTTAYCLVSLNDFFFSIPLASLAGHFFSFFFFYRLLGSVGQITFARFLCIRHLLETVVAQKRKNSERRVSVKVMPLA